jgi:hypothetical protein
MSDCMTSGRFIAKFAMLEYNRMNGLNRYQVLFFFS